MLASLLAMPSLSVSGLSNSIIQTGRKVYFELSLGQERQKIADVSQLTADIKQLVIKSLQKIVDITCLIVDTQYETTDSRSKCRSAQRGHS